MEFLARTDVGKKRSNNEDSYFAKKYNDKVSLYIVADGLGGYLSGEVASSVAVKKISDYIEKNLSKFEKFDERKIANILTGAIYIANENIYALEKTDEKYKGMATTIVVVLTVNNKVYYSSVGDSRMYYIDSDLTNIVQITKDDTYVNELIKTNVISENQAKNHPQKHILTKAIGVFKNLSVDVNILKEEEGYILLCSDGVTNMMSDLDIMSVFRKNEFCKWANKIVELANSNGGTDNITLVILKL